MLSSKIASPVILHPVKFTMELWIEDEDMTGIEDQGLIMLLNRSWGLGSNTVGNSAGRRRERIIVILVILFYLLKKKPEGKTEGKTAPYIQNRRPLSPTRPDKKHERKKCDPESKQNVISGCAGSGPRGRTLSGSGLWSRFP